MNLLYCSGGDGSSARIGRAKLHRSFTAPRSRNVRLVTSQSIQHTSRFAEYNTRVNLASQTRFVKSTKRFLVRRSLENEFRGVRSLRSVSGLENAMLEGKTILITGASSGIGRATAEVVARQGASVVIAARRGELCAQVAEEIRADGGEATHIRADVTDPTEVSEMVRHAIATFGKLDGAFNNAGVLLDSGRIHELDDEVLRRSWEINVNGIWLCMKAEINAMLEQGNGGSIVNDSSRNGLRADIRRPAYTATKHAVTGLTKAAALDYARMNIRINGICPGPIDTEMMRAVDRGDQEVRRRIESMVPLARYGQPEEVGELVAWLLSDQASYITGQMVGIDGGLLAS